MGHGGHDGGAGGVEHKAAPEQNHMALLQAVGPALGKYAHGVKAQRKGDGNNGGNQLSGHGWFSSLNERGQRARD